MFGLSDKVLERNFDLVLVLTDSLPLSLAKYLYSKMSSHKNNSLYMRLSDEPLASK